MLCTPSGNCLQADFEGKYSHFYMWANGLGKGNTRLVFQVLHNLCVLLHAFLTKWSSSLWFLSLPSSYQKHTSTGNLTYTSFVSLFPLHSCIVFLCQLLLVPQWNFFLPPFLNQLFLVFELRFILCMLVCSYWLTAGSWLKTSGSAWVKGSVSWVGEAMGDVSKSSLLRMGNSHSCERASSAVHRVTAELPEVHLAGHQG